VLLDPFGLKTRLSRYLSLNQLKKKLNTLEIFAAAHTQTSTRKTMLSKPAGGSFKAETLDSG
jgi:hypothetical protein